MDKQKKKIVTAFVLMLCAAAVVLVVYYVITRQSKDTGEEKEPGTEVEKLLVKDLDTKYPVTPAEVVKLYWRFNKCMYNEKMDDEEFEKLLEQLRKLYDEEFLAREENSWENMLSSFKSDREDYRKNKRNIAMYSVESNSSTVYGEVDGKECAYVMCNALIKQKSERTKVYEKFMCRDDGEGKWKILGWEQLDSQDEEDSEEK